MRTKDEQRREVKPKQKQEKAQVNTNNKANKKIWQNRKLSTSTFSVLS